jgi:hypothetical protein
MAPAPPPPRRDWRARLQRAFTEQLALKGAAIFFALVLWLVVSAEEPSEEVVAVRFAPALDSGVTIEGETPTVRALVVGRGRELLKLYNEPPFIRRRIRSGMWDSVRVELGPADVDLPAGVNAAVRDVRPRVLTVRLRRPARPAPEDTVTNAIPIGETPDTLVPPPDTTARDTSRRDTTAGPP